MDGICLIWPRGRLIFPSLPAGGDRYLSLSSQKRPAGRNLGVNRLVRRSGTTSVRYCCLGVLFAHAQVPLNFSAYHIRGKEISVCDKHFSVCFDVANNLYHVHNLEKHDQTYTVWLLSGHGCDAKQEIRGSVPKNGPIDFASKNHLTPPMERAWYPNIKTGFLF